MSNIQSHICQNVLRSLQVVNEQFPWQWCVVYICLLHCILDQGFLTADHLLRNFAILVHGMFPMAARWDILYCVHREMWEDDRNHNHKVHFFQNCPDATPENESLAILKKKKKKKKTVVNVTKPNTLVHTFLLKCCFLCSCYLKYLVEWQTV